MIRFNNPEQWFIKNGLEIFCAQLLIFIICLPPFHFGTWFQIETSMLVMFFFGSLTSLWLAFGIAKGWLIMERPAHPLIYILCAWSVWQIIVTIAAKNPILSWLGSPQQGEGAAFHIILVLSTFLAMPLWSDNRHKKILLLFATASLCTMMFLHFDIRRLCDPMAGTIQQYTVKHKDNPLAPANWPDYLAFIASWLWIAYASSPSIRNPSRHWLGILVFSSALLVSSSKSAYILIFPMIIASSIMLRLHLIKAKLRYISLCINAGKAWKILAIIGFITPLSWIVISQYQTLFPCKSGTMEIRASFNQVAISPLKENPSRLVFGSGWGSFSEDLFVYGLVDGQHSFENGKITYSSLPLVESSDGEGDHHSHNQSVSALHSLGVIGFLLFISIPIVAMFHLRKSLFWWCVPVLIGVNALGSFWFVIPQVMAFQALGLAALCAGRPTCVTQTKTPLPKLLTIIFFTITILLSATTIEQGKVIVYGIKFWQINSLKPHVHNNDSEWMKEDIRRGGVRLLFHAIAYAKTVATKIDNGTATENDRDWYRDFLNVGREAGTSPNTKALLRIIEPKLSMMLLFDFKKQSPLDELKPEIRTTIIPSILRITESAPLREDFIAPFLINLNDFTQGDSNQQRIILEQIITVAPNHRSALWLLGTLYENSPETRDTGIAMKRRAVLLGVDRVYPVTTQEILVYK